MRVYIVILISLVGLSTLSAQKKSKDWWLGAGYLYPAYAETLPEEVKYEAHLFRLYAAYAPFNQHSFWYRLSFTAEPQYAAVSLPESDRREKDYGINFGARFDWLTIDNLRSYVFLSTGPHFITTETVLQTKGFLFSDNIGFGVLIAIKETPFDIGIEGRFRHMSNAGIHYPNGGIDNAFVGLSILYKPNWDGGCYSCPRW